MFYLPKTIFKLSRMD